MSGTILEEILSHKREEVARRASRTPRAAVERAAEDAPPPRDFAEALRGGDVRLIAEVKRRSPSKGDIRPDLDPAAVAQAYERAGAAAVSVLTDEHYFGGSLDDLRAVRHAVDLPVLRKDFIVDAYQVAEARSAGADAILLIAAALSKAQMRDYRLLAEEWGMAALVEVHGADELEAALQSGARIVGINNRDLATFSVDLAVTERLAGAVPADLVLVAESGIASRADVQRLAAWGVDAILVGEMLARREHPGEAAAQLVGVPSRPEARRG